MMARLQAESEEDNHRNQIILQTILEHQETFPHSRDLTGWITVWSHGRMLEELAERLDSG